MNQQLKIDINTREQQGVKEIDWRVYIFNRMGQSMKICVDALIDERIKNICDTLMRCDGTNIVAFVNSANIDGIEDKWMILA